MNQNTQARIVGTNVEIDPAKPGDFGLLVPIKSLCELCKIGYTGQPTRINGDAVEIAPPRVGYGSVTVPIATIRNFYKQ